MSEYHVPVPGGMMDADEKIEIYARRHWVAFLGNLLLGIFLYLIPLVILIILAVYLPSIYSSSWRGIIIIGVGIYYLIMTAFIFLQWISYYFDIIIVTNKRVVDIIQEGLFDRKITEIPLLRVQDVTGEIKGFFQTLFGYGNVVVETAGEGTLNLKFKDVPNPLEISSKIQQLHDTCREQESEGPISESKEGVGA
jgi:uncharacterized membrane protein YdbT with pleckstrin-like domain